MGNKVLSIVMPAYNMAAYIERSIKSILVKEVMPFVEVIIVNDGSSDQTLGIARSYESKYPDYIKVIDKPNGNYGSAINAALKVAQGKYFKTLDSDDWYNTDNYIKYVEALRSCNEDLVINGYSYYFADTQNIVSAFTYKEQLWNQCVDLTSTNLFCLGLDYQLNMPAMAFRTRLLQDCDLHLQEHTFYTDTEYTYYPFQLAKTIRLLAIDLYVYYLGRIDQSMSKVNILKNFDSKYRIIRRMVIDYIETPSESFSRVNKKFLLRKNLSGFYHYIYLSEEHKIEIDEIDQAIKVGDFQLYKELETFVQYVGVKYLKLYRKGECRSKIIRKINRKEHLRGTIIYRIYQKIKRFLNA